VGVRNRSNIAFPQHGVIQTWNGNTLIGTVNVDVNLLSQSMTDTIGSYGTAHAMNAISNDFRGLPPCNGRVGNSSCTNYYSPIAQSISNISITSVSNPSVTSVSASTNVSRPDLNPLSLIQDMIDIPRQLRDAGRLARKPSRILNAKEIANKNLGVQFGWLPLISDARKLLQTQSRVESRFQRLRKLYDTGGERRYGTFSTQTAGDTLSAVFGPIGSCVAIGSRTTVRKQWYSARWKLLTRVPQFPNYQEMHSAAWRIANGLTPRGIIEGAWDLMPWSFLIDWYSDYGNFLASNANSIPVQLAEVCYMNKLETSITWSRSPSAPSGFSWSGGSVKRKEMFRNVGTSPLTNAQIPGLSWNQVSLLGSLFVQRFL
jgi:hypothetical protein